MLILTRRSGQTIIISSPHHDNIEVTVLGMEGSNVRIGVDAPQEVGVDREEIWLKKIAGADHED